MSKKLPWLVALTLVIITTGTIYGTVQQAQRREANYPQIQLAQDVAAVIKANPEVGADISSPLVEGKVDMSTSLAPFTIIYDSNGYARTGNGYLGGQLPAFPAGALKVPASEDYHAVTWQPNPKVRIAAVSVKAGRYYVVSGRSLKEVEKNEAAGLQITTTGLALSMLVLGVAYWLTRRSSKSHDK